MRFCSTHHHLEDRTGDDAVESMEEKGHPDWVQLCKLLGASMNRADDIIIEQPDRDADQEAGQDKADAKDRCKGDDGDAINCG